MTLKVRPSAQCKVLDFMGVYYRKRPDGSLLVLSEHVTTVSVQPREPALRFAKAQGMHESESAK